MSELIITVTPVILEITQEADVVLEITSTETVDIEVTSPGPQGAPGDVNSYDPGDLEAIFNSA